MILKTTPGKKLLPIITDKGEQKMTRRYKLLYPIFVLLLTAPILLMHWSFSQRGLNALRSKAVGSLQHSGEGLLRARDNLGSVSIGRKLIEKARRACRPAAGRKDVPKLVTIHEWRSKKYRPKESVSIITQLSIDRLNMLENQCRTWTDHLIATVYVPLYQNSTGGMPIVPTYRNTTLEDAMRGMDAFFLFMESTAQCALHMQLVGQFLDPLEPEQYPINSLRNRAMDMAETDLILLLDVDFVASAQLGLPRQGYRDPAVYDQLVQITKQKRALVLPAFEVTNRKQNLIMAQNFARHMVVAGKAAIREHYLAGRVDAFNGLDAPWGHGPTNTSKWILLDRPITYKIDYEPRYEPFVLLHREEAPWFDERFIGYGGNKIAYINQLHGLGFTFHVHPFGFTIHVPHVRTKAANVFLVQKRAGESKMEDLRGEVEEEVTKGSFVPITVFCDEDRH